MKREGFKSRLGFILVSAGCAIGIGNVWRFPYVVGQNGGGLFVLLYLIFLFIMGVPVLTMELAVGRGSRKSAVLAYKALEKPGSKWHIHGWFCMLGCYMLMMYYTTVSGWMLSYFFKFAAGVFPSGMSSDAVGGVFSGLLSSPLEMAGWMAVTVVLGFVVCSQGLQNGIEKISKIMMMVLLVLILVLAIHSGMLPGAKEGIRFYLVPSLAKVKEVGIGKVITAAMNQSFFTLSLGMGGMAIFGSYIDKKHALLGESINVALLDTFVAVVSGLIIFPACFTYNVEAGAGPKLIFVTLPNVFNHMQGGRLWGSLFFVFMSFAALSTVLAVFENILACCRDLFGWSRKKACLINCILMLILSLPCALGFNVLSGIHPMGGTSTFLDLEDFLVSNLILPIGSLIFLLFSVSKRGWGWKNFLAEANAGKGPKVKNWMRGYMTYVLPFLFIVIFIMGIIPLFQK